MMGAVLPREPEERTVRRYAEMALAIFALCSLSGSTFFFSFIGIDPTITMEELEQFDVQIRNFYLVIYLIVLFLCAINWRTVLLGMVAVWPIMAVLGLCWLSYFWSIDPETTYRRDIALTITTLMGVYLFARFELPDALRVLSIGLGLLALASIVVAIAMPEVGVHADGDHAGAWRGVFVHKNFTGRVMILATVAMLAAWFTPGVSRLLLAILLLATLLVLVASTSKTAYLSAVALLGACLAVRMVRGRPLRSALATLALLAVIWLGGVLLSATYEQILLALGRDPTLTGRTELWSFVMSQISLDGRWLTGFGYDAFWASDYGPGSRYKVDWGIDHAHNAWIEMVLNTGLIGAVLMLGICLMTVYRGVILARYYQGTGASLLVMGVMFTLLTAGMSEPVFIEKHSITWIMIVLAVGCARALTAQLVTDSSATDEPEPVETLHAGAGGWRHA